MEQIDIESAPQLSSRSEEGAEEPLTKKEEEERRIAEMGRPMLGEHVKLEVVIEESYEFKVEVSLWVVWNIRSTFRPNCSGERSSVTTHWEHEETYRRSINPERAEKILNSKNFDSSCSAEA